jgi:hypothetical protein
MCIYKHILHTPYLDRCPASEKYKKMLLDQEARTDKLLLKQEAKTNKLFVDQETRYDKLMLQILEIQKSLPSTRTETDTPHHRASSQIHPSIQQQNNITTILCCNAWCEIPTSCLKNGKHKRECDGCLKRHKK